MVSELRFLPISHLKLDCQLVTTDLSLSGRDRKLASIEIARKPKKPRSAQILVNDIMSFSEQPYSYRRAMLEYYIKDGEAVVKNPRLYTGDSSKAVEIWCDWARQHGKDGLQIYFHDYPYAYHQTTNILTYRTRQTEQEGL